MTVWGRCIHFYFDALKINLKHSMCPKTCFALLGVVHKLLHRRWGMGVSLFFDTHKELIVRGGGGVNTYGQADRKYPFF